MIPPRPGDETGRESAKGKAQRSDGNSVRGVAVFLVPVFFTAGRPQDARKEDADNDGHHEERRSNMHDDLLRLHQITRYARIPRSSLKAVLIQA